MYFFSLIIHCNFFHNVYCVYKITRSKENNMTAKLSFVYIKTAVLMAASWYMFMKIISVVCHLCS